MTPIPKVPEVLELTQIRKIAFTSDLSKLLEGILKDWILQDIEFKLDTSQYGRRKGSGTEHLIVCYVDRVLKLLDSTTAQSAVIAAAADFVSAFDKTDPTLTAAKFISIGIRPSIIPILISYMTNRKMIVKFKGTLTQPYDLIGGGPQGTLLGGLQYIITSNNCSIEKVKVRRYF